MADNVVETVDPAASVVCDECAGSSWTDDLLNFLSLVFQPRICAERCMR
jgi:hypothetical protein